MDVETIAREWIPISVRVAFCRAISDPGAVVGDRRTGENFSELLAHWQARAVVETVKQQLASSPHFADAVRQWLQENGG
jgi:hypothetical protein